MHVLVVDDLRLNRIVLGRLLRSLDLHVIEACDGRAGLEAYLQRGGDVGMVFMDIMMPVCNGIQAVLSIRSAESRQGWLPVPIVAFTSEDVAHGSPLWLECMQSGFNDVVPKPMNKGFAVQLLCRWMPSLRQRAAAPCSPATRGSSSVDGVVCSACGGSAATAAPCSRCGSGSSSAKVAATLMQPPQPLRWQLGLASDSTGDSGSCTSVQQLRSSSSGAEQGGFAHAEVEASSRQRLPLG
ncbi:hypothetical protein ABPG77_000097 [Micractinium sp. CCAP 211/92]